MSDNFGRALANLGDLDSDGVSDLAVGAFLDNDGGTDRGAVWILFMNTDGTVKSEQKISDIAGGFNGILDNGDNFGESVASLGDLDNDRVSDLAVGAILDDDGGIDRGAVWILFMNTDGTVKSEQKISDTAGGFNGILDNSDTFGASVAGMGDLDGDGVTDLAVGADGDDDGGHDFGSVWILFLNAAPGVPTVTIIQPPDGAIFNSGTNIVFQATATDPEDGDIRASTVWTSDIQEGSKTGGVVETSNLIDGVHVITATVTDSAGNTLSKSITITVSNNPPTVSIIQPVNGSAFASGATITGEGTAADPEDGDISGLIVWTSSIQEGSMTGSVSNQQKWDTLGAERSGAGWRSGELPEGPVVASSPFGGLSLHLLPAL